MKAKIYNAIVITLACVMIYIVFFQALRLDNPENSSVSVIIVLALTVILPLAIVIFLGILHFGKPYQGLRFTLILLSAMGNIFLGVKVAFFSIIGTGIGNQKNVQNTYMSWLAYFFLGFFLLFFIIVCRRKRNPTKINSISTQNAASALQINSPLQYSNILPLFLFFILLLVMAVAYNLFFVDLLSVGTMIFTVVSISGIITAIVWKFSPYTAIYSKGNMLHINQPFNLVSKKITFDHLSLEAELTSVPDEFTLKFENNSSYTIKRKDNENFDETLAQLQQYFGIKS